MNVYVNGSIIKEEEAVISVYDHGFLYGIGLFETFRTYGGRPFLIEEHQRRMEASCKELGISYIPDKQEWESIVEELLQSNGLEDAYIRFTVTAGADALGLPAGDYDKPSVVVYVKGLPPRNEELYRSGKPLQLLALPRNTPEGQIRFKSLHYMNSILAKRELAQYAWAAGAEGLQLTQDGYLAEGIVSNVFFVKNDRLYTPSLDTGILSGITRAHVVVLARQLLLPVEEGRYTWQDLLNADEVFITNSIQELVPISTLFDTNGQRHIVASGTAGYWTLQLLTAYQSSIDNNNE
ncbi:4-amino-4-deoxychorismate lyase [Paenibacillus sp. H1-7]|nr:4-amino-4-deoxychorismate lyase [Paenibacillus sp. H1-7]